MNRLGNEKSPYLLQHKDNPVAWYPWGDEAFLSAKRENKPIFLSIGYSTCYWCHMMEKDSFEIQEVADLLNQYFISIKVDREEHPDVDQIYMDAVVGMTGQGGWPLSVFLTPDLKPFFGGTFFWKAQFMQLLSQIQSVWQNTPEKVLNSSDQILKHLQEEKGKETAPMLDENLLRLAFKQFQESFDDTYGGFGKAPKFPHSMNLSLLLRIYHRTGNEEALSMVTKTLDAMAKGGIYDRVGGGFHRYATKENWDEPHYEKMLYDNALLTLTYLEAAQVTQKDNYKTVVRETLDYVLREMTHPEGGFYSAQDAGEVGQEGDYYIWREKTIEKERQARGKRKPPHKDDKILTAWNGLMIHALAKGYQVLGDTHYLIEAQKAARFIQKTLFKDGKLLRRYREGDARFLGTLDDYSFLIQGLLTLYESDFDPSWLFWAKELETKQDALFWDEKEGGYFFTDLNETTLIVRKKTFHDGAIPSGNAVAGLNLLRLNGFFFEKEYSEKFEKLIRAASKPLKLYPAGHAQMLIALDYYWDRSKEIAVIGNISDKNTKTILNTLYQNFLPNKVMASGKGDHIPLLQGKSMISGKTTIYVCENNTCKLPTTDMEQAKQFIQDIKKYDL